VIDVFARRIVGWRALPTLCLITVIPLAGEASPSAGSWRRMVVLGDNGAHAFLLRSEWSQPGSYYSTSEKVSIVRIRLSDWSTEETWVLRSVAYSQDMNSFEWMASETDSSTADLAAILRTFKVRPVFAETSPAQFGIDSTGVWAHANDRRVVVATMEQLRQRIPDLSWEPSVVRVEKGWGHGQGFYYLTVRSGACAGDVNWFEDIVAVPHQTILDMRKASPLETQHK
jgi:hypothetical protein